jgi:hypothetical protein
LARLFSACAHSLMSIIRLEQDWPACRCRKKKSQRMGKRWLLNCLSDGEAQSLQEEYARRREVVPCSCSV